MPKYVRAKKYLRFIVPVIIVIGAILVPKAGHQAKIALGEVSRHRHTADLQVSTSGQKMYTDVAASSLQQADAPAYSATSAGLSPQQAVPNYCAPGEIPVTDGCITQ